MLADIVDLESNISFNSILANKIGLNAAVYCQVLINIQKKAVRKRKLIDNTYFRVNREYVKKVTSLTFEDQLNADEVLYRLTILEKPKKDCDLLKLDIGKVLCLISEEDNAKALIAQALNGAKVPKATKKEAINNALVNSLNVKDGELRDAIKEWVEVVNSEEAEYKPLNKASIKDFYDEVNRYTKCDLDMALEIYHVATAGYCKNASTAIKNYESKKNTRKYNNNGIYYYESRQENKSSGEVIEY